MTVTIFNMIYKILYKITVVNFILNNICKQVQLAKELNRNDQITNILLQRTPRKLTGGDCMKLRAFLNILYSVAGRACNDPAGCGVTNDVFTLTL